TGPPGPSRPDRPMTNGTSWSRAGWRAHLSLADAAVGDAAVGDAAVGDAAVGDAAVGDAAVADAAVADAAVADAAVADLVARLGTATIPDLAAESAAQFPDRVAVSVDGVPVTHAGLDAAAGRVAGWLAGRIA